MIIAKIILECIKVHLERLAEIDKLISPADPPELTTSSLFRSLCNHLRNIDHCIACSSFDFEKALVHINAAQSIISANFEIQSGVRQGCILSLTFFCRRTCYGSIQDIIFLQTLWPGWSHLLPLTLSQGPGSNDLRFGKGDRWSYMNQGKQITFLSTRYWNEINFHLFDLCWKNYNKIFAVADVATKGHSSVRELSVQFQWTGKGALPLGVDSFLTTVAGSLGHDSLI